MLRGRKQKKQYGLAVVVRGKRSLQLRPLRRLVGYMIHPHFVHRNEYRVTRGPMFGNTILKDEEGNIQYEHKGDTDSPPDLWAMVEEEDDHTILDMSMFSIHEVLWNVTRGVFIERGEFERLEEEKHYSQKDTKKLHSLIDQFDHETRPAEGVRRRNRKRVGVLDKNDNIGGSKNSNNKDKNNGDVFDHKKCEELPLLLDFDDIADMTDTIEENEMHGIRGFFIHTKLSWDQVDVLTSMRLEDFVLSTAETALTTSELFILRMHRIGRVLRNIFDFKRHAVGVKVPEGTENQYVAESSPSHQPLSPDGAKSASDTASPANRASPYGKRQIKLPSPRVAPSTESPTADTVGRNYAQTKDLEDSNEMDYVALANLTSVNAREEDVRRGAMNLQQRSPMLGGTPSFATPRKPQSRLQSGIPTSSKMATPKYMSSSVDLSSPRSNTSSTKKESTPLGGSYSPRIPERKNTLYDKSLKRETPIERLARERREKSESAELMRKARDDAAKVNMVSFTTKYA